MTTAADTNLHPDNRWVTTFSGTRVYYESPDPDTILLADIAHHLAHQCRYAGGTSRFYSVAEHSIRVCKQVVKIDPKFALHALLHDAEEAYMPDIPRTIKHVDEMRWYRETADRLRRVIYNKYGLGTEVPDVVTMIDSQILYLEADQFEITLNLSCQPPQDLSIDWTPYNTLGAHWGWLPGGARDSFFHELNRYGL